MDFSQPRKWSLPFNAVLFNLCRLNPFRDKHIWVFGGHEGKKYDDNSRYMFEYVSDHHSDIIRAIWLTKDEKTAQGIRNKGYEAYIFKSAAGIKAALGAGVCVYSHALMDFGLFPLIGGAKIVCLWHGVGFKKIYNEKYRGVGLFAKKSIDKVFSWTHRDMTMITSEYTYDQFQRLFNLKPKDLYITGQPRNDAFKTLDAAAIKKSIGLATDERFIIYMPTYRQKSLGHNEMTEIVVELYNSKELDATLTHTNSVFVCKLHPLTPKINLSSRHNFRILDYAAVEDNQALMGAADVLVTDYSSCFVDFALLNRPIVFYTPDEEAFTSQSEAMEKEFWDIKAKSETKRAADLAQWLLEPSCDAVDVTNDLFEDKSIRGTCYSQNVYNTVVKEIRL